MKWVKVIYYEKCNYQACDRLNFGIQERQKYFKKLQIFGTEAPLLAPKSLIIGHKNTVA